MCLAIPGEVVTRGTDDGGLVQGTVSFGGIRKTVCLAYVPEAAIGDYVLVHAGFAIATLDEDEAARVFRTLEEMGVTGELDP